MPEVNTEVSVDRPIEEVFEFIHRPENDPEWQPEVLERSIEGRMQEGADLTIRRKVLGRVVKSSAQVDAFDPPRTSTARSFAGPLQFSGGFHLEPEDGGTRVTFQAEVQPTGAYEMGAEAFAEGFEKQIEANLARLKKVLEG